MQIELLKLDRDSHRVSIKDGDHTIDSVVLNTKTFFLHDLCHYCVEQALNYKKGFWGMIALGYKMSELTGKQNVLTEESRFIEKIVGPVQSIVSGYLPVEKFRDHTAYLNSGLADALPVEQVVNQINFLSKQWQGLAYGESLMLNFEIATSNCQ
jgi:hypothetical protein